jgi:Flp pilus assembly protein TadB
MPLGFFVLAALSSARDVLPVLATRAGATALVTGLVLQAAGMWAIRRIVRVEL